jgi:uracil-DNA glycosylase
MPDDPQIRSLSVLAAAEAECTRCPLYKFATQVVPGKGRRNSQLMLVGEQPGDREDVAGEPFVGPAGRILDQALAAAEIPRSDVFITNAVKHFKFEQRGKRRLHKRPSAYEVQRCKWWLDHERAIIRPVAIVALGATAGRSLFGKTIVIGMARGQDHRLADGTLAFVTIHPSYLLRIKDEADRERKFRAFVADLRRAGKIVARDAA